MWTCSETVALSIWFSRLTLESQSNPLKWFRWFNAIMMAFLTFDEQIEIQTHRTGLNLTQKPLMTSFRSNTDLTLI